MTTSGSTRGIRLKVINNAKRFATNRVTVTRGLPRLFENVLLQLESNKINRNTKIQLVDPEEPKEIC